MTTKEKIRFVILRSFGNFLLLMSLYGAVATFGPIALQELRFQVDTYKGVRYVVAEEKTMSALQSDVPQSMTPPIQPVAEDGFAAILDNAKERVLVAPDPIFSILIPKIGAASKVIPNVDPANEKEFTEKLKEGIAHAKGTVFPGIPGNTYLFAHSTDNWWNVGRYNAVFYLLKDLEVNDEIIVYFENKRFSYTVAGKYIAEPTEVTFLTHSRGAEEQLILQTCWPPGTTWKRLFIVAKPK